MCLAQLRDFGLRTCPESAVVQGIEGCLAYFARHAAIVPMHLKADETKLLHRLAHHACHAAPVTVGVQERKAKGP